MTITAYAQEAWLNGWHAHGLGVRRSENPYNATRLLVSRNAWDRGWEKRFVAARTEYVADDRGSAAMNRLIAMQMDDWL